MRQIRLSKSCLSDAERRAVWGVLEREYLGMGAEVQEFEKKLGDFLGRPAVCVATGTAALQLAVQAAGIGPGDEVLVPSLTFVATFQAIAATGATPVACEVEAATLTLDVGDAAKRLSSRVKAVMPVHYSGGVGNLSLVYDFAAQHNLRVIEDAAHAFGTLYRGQKIGGSGDVACFSFDGIKNITSGEGGCVVSNDEKLLERVRDARLLGVVKDTDKRYSGARSWEFDVVAQGWRAHMSNIMAAIGLVQLTRFPEFQQKRQRLAKRYVALLGQVAGIELLKINYEDVVPHIFVVKLPLGCRAMVQKYMAERGVQTGMHYQPAHTLSYFKQATGRASLEASEEIFARLLTLPLHPDLTEGDVDFVVGCLSEGLVAVEKAR